MLEGQGTKSLALEEESQWASNFLISGSEVEPNVEKFLDICTSIGKSPDLQIAAAAMKVCLVQLAHKTRVNFQTKRYQHRMLVLLYLEGSLE